MVYQEIVNPSHYGRICPIESPEGQNIGLITSLASYAKVDEYGFIMTPYRKVDHCKITDQVDYLTADEENDVIISQATVTTDDNNMMIDEKVAARFRGDNILVKPENDDTTRALMGANMQRQSVPLLKAEAPYVGTGVEYIAARDSGAAILAKADGIVEYVDAKRIVIKNKTGKDTYYLANFEESNQDSCYHHRPIVKVGDEV